MDSECIEKAQKTVREQDIAGCQTPVLLMVSGGSDSTALAYIACELQRHDAIGPIAMLHVNHQLRGKDAERDASFTGKLAEVLGLPLSVAEIDVAAIAESEHGNVEAVARRERYAAAAEALAAHCRQQEMPLSEGRILVAHTIDDRIENFYMRSIVGTGPGGFRSMRYLNGNVGRPLLDCSRDELRSYVSARAEAGLPAARDDAGALWREDATNAHTDRFRAFVRHEVVPLAKSRNPKLNETLSRTMNLIADEDDMLDDMAQQLYEQGVTWLEPCEDGCIISPLLAAERVPLQRRVAVKVVERLIGADARVETAAIDALLLAFDGGKPKSGYVANVQGNLAVSANKQGVRVEPMAAFRTRRKKM